MVNILRSDFLNIIFIIVAAFLALLLPFELFLFSYAFLGPLHYLTEINWLNSKKYFSKSKLPIYFIIAFTLILGLLYAISYFEVISSWMPKKKLVTIATYLILLSFLLVFCSELLKQRLAKLKYHEIIIFVVSLVLTVLILRNNYNAHLVTFIFLPTLIHVFIFTFLFMWIGYLKKPNSLAIISLIIMVAVPFFIAFMPAEILFHKTSKTAIDTYINSGFQSLNTSLYRTFNGAAIPENNFYETVQGLKIQSFIAFAYTYHYLNWFAKINIVGWSKSISKINFIVILFLWLIAVGIYIYDFKTGLLVLFFMSLGHVLLEFPLNIKVMKGILSHYQLKLVRIFK